MRRHMSMDQLAQEVLHSVVATERTKVASAPAVASSELGGLLVKMAAELRAVDGGEVSYADIEKIAEVRRAKR